MINGEQTVKMGEATISFNKYSRQIPVPFKIYADFECLLEKVDKEPERASETSRASDSERAMSKKYQNHIACGYSYNLVCVDDRFAEDAVVY